MPQLPFRRALAAALLCAVAAVLSACGSNAPTGATNASNSSGGSGGSAHPVITVGYTAGVTTIDPGSACDTPSYTTIQNLYDELVTTTGSVNVKPMLAQSWNATNSDKTYTFHLRHGVVFDSGNPMTSADVIWSLNYALKQDGCASYVLNSGFDKEIKSMSAPDKYTVVVNLRVPDPIFLQTMSQQVAILDSKTVEQHGGNSKAGATWLSTHAAGSGPFSLTTYQPDSQVVLTARKNYWGGEPTPSKVVIRIIGTPSTMELLANSGAINMAFNVPLEDLSKVSSEQGLKILSNPSQFYIDVGFNNAKSPFNNLQVRQALTYATPFDQIVKTYGYGYASGFVGPLLPVMVGYQHLPNPYPYDPAKAKSMLAAAGMHNLNLTMVEQSGYPLEQDVATVLQSAWKQVGVHLTVSVVPPSQFVDEVYNYKDQMYMVTDGPQGSIDPGFFFGYHVRCDDPFNWARYCNKTVSNMIEKARMTTDSSVSTPIYQQISSTVAKDAPYLELLSLDHVVVASKNLTGYTYYADQATRFNTLGLD
jgi:peptide/nickel transport system substrate-binding protein